MASRRYKTYKFLYTDDLGTTTIKRQRSYLNEDNSETTPITTLFLARVVQFAEKITGTSQGLRHLLTYIDGGRFIANIPYAPNDATLQAHIEEILAVERVECGDYRGERLIESATANSLSE